MPLVWAVPTVAALSLVAWRARAVDASGVAAGSVIALLLAGLPAADGFVAFALFVTVGSAVSRLGAGVKRERGVVERDGRRGAGHAVANAGVAGGVAALHLVGGLGAGTAAVLACGSLAGALSDTASSEIGTWLGGRPRHVLTLRRMPFGTDGAVTMAGTLAGFLAAAVIAGACTLAGPGGPAFFVAVACGGFAGNLADTLLGATLEPRLGRAGNAIVNLLATATAAWASVIFLRIFQA